MNERIRELLEQARIYSNSMYADPYLAYTDWQATKDKKFAELVVLECCKEIIQESFNAGAASSWLKDYFEVEE